MKKTIKTAMLSLAVLAAGFGGVKAYNAYNANCSELSLENIEALSQSGEGYVLPEVVISCDANEGKCWVRNKYASEDGKRHCSFSGSMDDYCTGVID